jgi:hypothetical protein
MQVLRHENRYPRDFGRKLQTPRHLEPVGQLPETLSEHWDVKLRAVPFDSHEKQPGFMVLMLIRVNDIGARFVQKCCHARYQSLLVRARHQ